MTTVWAEQPVALVATHLKPSAAALPYIVALRRQLESFPIVVFGMDANTPAGQQSMFGRQLTEQFLTHSARPGSQARNLT